MSSKIAQLAAGEIVTEAREANQEGVTVLQVAEKLATENYAGMMLEHVLIEIRQLCKWEADPAVAQQLRDEMENDSPAGRLHARLEQLSKLTNSHFTTYETLPRSVPRKQFAKVIRDLFKSLHLKGISVTTPNYSMAQGIEIKLPTLPLVIHDQMAWPHNHDRCCDQGKGHTEATRCKQCAAQAKAKDQLAALLNLCFPNHRDKSDTMSDYHNYCWSID